MRYKFQVMMQYHCCCLLVLVLLQTGPTALAEEVDCPEYECPAKVPYSKIA
jgi:hypothetical protein